MRACGQLWFDRACFGKALLLGAIKIIVFFTDVVLNSQKLTFGLVDLLVQMSFGPTQIKPLGFEGSLSKRLNLTDQDKKEDSKDRDI